MSFLSPVASLWKRLGIVRWLLLIALGVGAYFMFGREKVDPASQVISSAVKRGDVEVSVLATGKVEAAKTVDVGAQASGQIKRLAVQLGDRVKKGDLLAEIDPSVSQNDFDEAQMSIEGLQAQSTIKQLALDDAQQELARQKTMMAGDATPRKELESAANAVKMRQAEIRQLAAQLRQAEIKLATAKTNLGFTRIVAPMDGIVASIAVKEGQTVNAIQSAPTILTLADMDTMKVQAQVAEADVVRLKAGTPLYFSVLGAPETKIKGQVASVEPTPQTINNAIFYNAHFFVPNPQGLLRLQMTAQVTFILAEARNVLTIPVGAIGKKGANDQYSVKVLDAQGQIQDRNVSIGLRGNIVAEVKSGLKEGDQVVIASSMALDTSKSKNPPPPEPR
ncbi:macrolide transporter subunit MacA [Chitinibacter bivalviorum]|uniref:Macrolide transporter subunit MacA n=1 Tax=Chitinibacter bivalviorum TaxID=2739434 RepID=A0A7H9BN25_9NEIS|nr:macrolide transporter subunit MacA [Chitinibacter bivalviorum]QLG89491.1 macrolide transporter subunit MacA [Chitinibacter bivalviorum]